MKKILIVNDTADHSNWGSQACAGALRSILKECNVDTSVTIISNTMLNKKYALDPKFMGVRVLGAADPANPIRRILSKVSVPVPLVVDQFDEVAAVWMSKKTKATAEYMEKLKDIDAIVFNAEGSTYRINYGSIKALFFLWMAKTKLGIPAFFLNGSVTMTRVDPIMPAMLRTTFDVLDGIAVREPFSLRNVNEFAPNVTAEMIPDSVFHFPPTIAKEPTGEKKSRIQDYCETPFFCFSLSMLPVDYTAGRKESALLYVLLELKKIVPNIVLIARDPEDQFLKNVAIDTGAMFLGPDYSYAEIMYVLGKARFLLSGRYHHIIMATIMGCPSVALRSTSHKVDGLAELLSECMSAPHDPTSLRLAKDLIIKDVKRILNEGDVLRRKCSEIAAVYREKTSRLGEMVAEVI